MLTKITAFEFNSVQNARTLAQIVRRDEGNITIDLFIEKLERYITDKNKEMKLGVKQPEPGLGVNEYTTSVPDKNAQKRAQRETRRQITAARRTHVEKLRASTPCPECGKGRVVEEVREGIKVRACSYPKPIGPGLFKFESGCGWSEMVE